MTEERRTITGVNYEIEDLLPADEPGEPGRPPSIWRGLGLLLGPVILGVSVVLIGLAVMGGLPDGRGAFGPTASASPSASPATNQSSEVAPTPASTPEATPNLPLFQAPIPSLAVVRVNDLRVRAAPSLSAPELVDGETAIRLQAGDRVLVVGVPVDADGIRWFAVAREEEQGNIVRLTVGWAAAGTASEPWIETEQTGSCPVESGLADLVAVAEIVRVGCYGSQPLLFEAYQAAEAPDGGLGGACGTEPPVPAWLACDNINHNWVNADGGADWLFLLHFDPGTGIPPTGLAAAGTTGSRLRVTGHFLDPAAVLCVTASDPNSAEAMSQWLTCAALFAVESIEVVP